MSSIALSVVNSITQTATQTSVTGTINDPIIALALNTNLPGTGSMLVPAGTTGQRLLQGAGSLRFNTTTSLFEVSTDGATWVNLAVGGGGIASVTGTANRITCTAGPNVVVDIAATYVGQTSITTLGTIGTGTWQGTVVGMTYGGSGANLTASNGGIVWSNATQFQILAGTATAGKVLQSGATATPSWSTPTYPSASGLAGQIIRSDGTNNVYSTSTFADTYSASNLLYSNGANTVTGLATANRAVITTTSAGVPVATSLAADGQLIIGSTAGAPAAATLTAGSNITITNAGNSITIASTGSSTGTLASFQVLTTGTAATYTKPAGITNILVEVLGGGGGGGGMNSAVAGASAAGGGGGGGYARKLITSAAATYTYTVGAAGTLGGAGNNPGGAGGTSSFSTISSTGGAGGTGGTNSAASGVDAGGGAGGVGSGGDINITGNAGDVGLIFTPVGVSTGGAGANTFFGPGSLPSSAAPGNSQAGLSTPPANSGAGGGGACGSNVNANQAGTAGGSGIIIVWEFK